MNYEQFYAYLDTRPLEEVKECMDSLGNLVRGHDDKSASDAEEVSNPNQSPTVAIKQLHMAQQVWAQQAVWNKLGSETSGDLSPSGMAKKASNPFTTKEAAQYIVDVTKHIDEEVDQSESQLKDIPPPPASSTLSSDMSHSLTPNRPNSEQQTQERFQYMKQFHCGYNLTDTELVARGSTRGSTQDVPVSGPTRW